MNLFSQGRDREGGTDGRAGRELGTRDLNLGERMPDAELASWISVGCGSSPRLEEDLPARAVVVRQERRKQQAANGAEKFP